jgi:hypothetical protein
MVMTISIHYGFRNSAVILLRACLEERVLEGIEEVIIPCYSKLNYKGL